MQIHITTPLKIVLALILLSSCTMTPKKKKHYAKKYSSMLVSDIALG